MQGGWSAVRAGQPAGRAQAHEQALRQFLLVPAGAAVAASAADQNKVSPAAPSGAGVGSTGGRSREARGGSKPTSPCWAGDAGNAGECKGTTAVSCGAGRVGAIAGEKHVGYATVLFPGILPQRALEMRLQVGPRANANAFPLEISSHRQSPMSSQVLGLSAVPKSAGNPWSLAHPSRLQSDSSETAIPVGGKKALHTIRTYYSSVESWFPIIKETRPSAGVHFRRQSAVLGNLPHSVLGLPGPTPRSEEDQAFSG